MEWKYINPPTSIARDETGNITETITIIQCDNPYTVLTGKLQGDWTNKDKADVIDAVLEYNHKLLFVNRAMAESVLKVDKLDKAVEELRVANKQQIDLAVADLTNLIVGIMGGTSEVEEDELTE